jgi:hypothetical protein
MRKIQNIMEQIEDMADPCEAIPFDWEKVKDRDSQIALAVETVTEMHRLLSTIHDYVCESGSFASEWAVSEDLKQFFSRREK